MKVFELYLNNIPISYQNEQWFGRKEDFQSKTQILLLFVQSIEDYVPKQQKCTNSETLSLDDQTVEFYQNLYHLKAVIFCSYF